MALTKSDVKIAIVTAVTVALAALVVKAYKGNLEAK